MFIYFTRLLTLLFKFPCLIWDLVISKSQIRFSNLKSSFPFITNSGFAIQDAITDVKQQCSDFVMTRNIQCREMIDDVQRQIAGLSFQDGNKSNGYSYPPVGHTPSSNPQQRVDPGNHPQTPVYQPPPHPTMPHPIQTTPYGTPPQYHAPLPGHPYPPPQNQQPAVSHDHGQPVYGGWQGSYCSYGAPLQQNGSMPRPTYSVQSPCTPPQGGYYRQ